jgi:hypothetical protein
LNKIEMVDDSGKKQFMSEKQWLNIARYIPE